MSRPVSLLVWFDAKTDPPTGDMERMVLVRTSGGQTSCFRAYNVKPYSHATYDNYPALQPRLWAELPVVGELTDDDVRVAADCIGWESYWALGKTDGGEADRLRAALGGEKEEG